MLVAMRLKNCQSWEDSTIEFSTKKPNILIADNNTGKSVIMKMLKITANPKVYSASERKELIRYGEDSAMLVCAFDDGAVSMTIVYPERVIYRFRQNEEQSFATYSEPPQIMLDHLGLITNKNIDFIANIIDMDQDLFLVNTKSSGNVAMLKLLAEEPILGEVLQKIEELSPRIKDEIRLTTLHSSDLESSLSRCKYIDIDLLEATIVKAEITLTLYDRLIELYSQSDVLSTIVFDNTDYDNQLLKLDCLLECKHILDAVDSLMYDSADYTGYFELARIMACSCEISDKFACLNYDSTDYSTISNYVSLQGSILQCYKELQDYEMYMQQLEEQETEIKEIRKEISQSGKVIQCPIKGDVLFIDEKCVPYN